MKSMISSFFCGSVFALGLGVGGMTDPRVVQGFLDIFGAWRADLIFVMIGGLVTHFLTLRLVLKRKTPVIEQTFHLPTKNQIDARLIFGSVLFGVGWGISGFCPGPALVSAGAQMTSALVFVPFMLFGMWVAQRMEALRGKSPQ
jgi:uncharacterized membrane protein YedE/YeeE